MEGKLFRETDTQTRPSSEGRETRTSWTLLTLRVGHDEALTSRIRTPATAATTTKRSHDVGRTTTPPPSHSRRSPWPCPASPGARHPPSPEREASWEPRGSPSASSPPYPQTRHPDGQLRGPTRTAAAQTHPQPQPTKRERRQREQRRPQPEREFRAARRPRQQSRQRRLSVQRPLLCQPVWDRSADGRPGVGGWVVVFKRERGHGYGQGRQPARA